MSLSERILSRAETRELDTVSIEELLRVHLDGRVVVRYAMGQGNWKQGDGEPAIVLDPPSAQAAGRCVASRVRGIEVRLLAPRSIHPKPCRWCPIPLETLLKSLDHATFLSRFVTTEYIVWPTKDAEAPYVRATTRSGTYENPSWATFFSLARDDRAYLIAEAAALPVGAAR